MLGHICGAARNSLTIRILVTILSRVSTVLSEIIVIGSIWIRTYSIARSHVRAWTFKNSLVWYLLRDGTSCNVYGVS